MIQIAETIYPSKTATIAASRSIFDTFGPICFEAINARVLTICFHWLFG